MARYRILMKIIMYILLTNLRKNKPNMGRTLTLTVVVFENVQGKPGNLWLYRQASCALQATFLCDLEPI